MPAPSCLTTQNTHTHTHTQLFSPLLCTPLPFCLDMGPFDPVLSKAFLRRSSHFLNGTFLHKKTRGKMTYLWRFLSIQICDNKALAPPTKFGLFGPIAKGEDLHQPIINTVWQAATNTEYIHKKTNHYQWTDRQWISKWSRVSFVLRQRQQAEGERSQFLNFLWIMSWVFKPLWAIVQGKI